MTQPSITVRNAGEADIDRIELVLESNGLPYQDVRRKAECFFTVHSDTEFIGTAGVETYGSDGLLRSVVITEPNRGRGYGAALCAALEDRARTQGVERLYLLTTTAAPFFSRQGYDPIAREAVPASIRRTSEFTELCPDSATCMRKLLRD